MPITVEVTQEDIDRGTRYRSDSCPIALALNRQHYRRRPWEVRYAGVRSRGNRLWVPPPAAVRFADLFDAGRPVSPATFTLTEARS